MPTAEALFWQQVRAGRLNGLKFKRQVPIPPYVADFLCASARLIVELDGAPHETAQRKVARCEARRMVGRTGLPHLRFPNDRVLGNLGLVLDEVMAAIPAAPLPLRGRVPCAAGEGSDGSGYGVDVAADAGDGSARPGTVAPLSRPLLTQGPPSPAEGGGKDARGMAGTRPPIPSKGGKGGVGP